MTARSRLWFGLIVLALVLAAIQWTIGWPQLLTPWRAIPPAALALAAVLTLGSYTALVPADGFARFGSGRAGRRR